MNIVDLTEQRQANSALNPTQALRDILSSIESGEMLGPMYMTIVIHDGDAVRVFSSGWHGDDILPSVGLLQAGQKCLLDDLMGD